MDERPERVWIHPNLKNLLIKLNEIINKKSLKETGYPIPKGLPISSKIAASLLENLISNKDFLDVEKLDKSLTFNTKLCCELKHPVFLIVFDPRENNVVEDKEYLNLNLFKKRGIKENEIQFI